MALNPPSLAEIDPKLYVSLFETLQAPILFIDGQTGAILDANPAACVFYGYSHAELTGKTIFDLSALSLEETSRRVSEIAAGETSHMHTRHRLANGKVCDVNVVLGRHVSGEMIINIAVISDISAQVQAEVVLRESEEKYHGFVSQAYDAFTLTDERGVVIEWNQAAEKMTGISASEALGQFAWDMQLRVNSPEKITEEMRNQVRQRIEAVLQSGVSPILNTYVTQIKRSDGEKILAGQKLFTIKTTKGFQLGTIAYDLTLEKQAEAALRESEAHYRALFENMHEGFALQEIIQDENGRVVDFRILDANPAYEQHTGRTPQDVIGRTLREITPNADPVQIERYGDVALTGKPLDFEYYSKTFDRYILVRSFRPQPNQFATIFEDVTERHLAEQALQTAHAELEQRVLERTSELSQALERLDLATSAAKIGIWDWDVQQNKVVWDEQIYALYGVKPESFDSVYEYWLNGIHPDDREAVNQIVQQALHGDGEYVTEYRVLWPDGSLHWLKGKARVFRDEQGVPIRMVGVNYDISERKFLEAELRESEQRYATLFERSAVPTALVQLPDITFRKVNTACEELCEYTDAEMFGKTTIELGLEGVQDRLQTFSTFERRNGLNDHEIQLTTKGGKERIVLITSVPIMISGQPYAISTMVDITERKQAEMKLAETNIALEKALRTKDEFMAAMSHELRTPLTSILGMTESFQMPYYGPLSDKQRKAIDLIETNGNRLLDMINSVLDYSQLQSGKIKIQSKPSNLTDICQAALQTIEPTATKKRQQIHFSIAPEPIILTTDKYLILQLLKCLLKNASKFTFEAGEFGIEVMGDREEKLVRLCVWDKGIGIQEQDFPRLFQPFVQLDASLSRPYEGAGLGLFLAKRIAELLGGSVSVESVVGQGSRFTVTMPWIN